MRFSEHDDDRWVRVRASVIEDGENRIRELEAELAKANQLLTHAGILKAQEEFNAERERCKTAVLALNHSQADNAHLRSCLKRLEWEATPMGVYCRACGNNHGAGHTSDCWLAAECKEGK